MILVNKNGLLVYKNKKYQCQIGKNGISKKKIEGDGCTPLGTFSLGKLYVRTDRIKNLITKFNSIAISQSMGWSDNPERKDYNSLINSKFTLNEKLFRKDHIYDIILVVNYNMQPIIPNKGSAIFIHISQKNNPTSGCISLNKNNLIEILTSLKPSDKIKITE